MKTKYILVSLGVLTSISFYFYSLPPYYLTAYVAKYSKSEIYENLNKLVDESSGFGTYRLTVADDLLIRGVDANHSVNAEKQIIKLMKESNTIIMTNSNNILLFMLGNGNISDLNYRVALVKKKESYKNNIMKCEKTLFEGKYGKCLYDFNETWGVLYWWVTLK